MTCCTCGRRGHGYQRCLDRICKGCHGKGHDIEDCTTGWRMARQQRGKSKEVHKKRLRKKLGVSNQADERAASISVKIGDSTICALLDTGAKVNVMDVQTMRELGLTNRLRAETGHVFGVGGAPVTVVGKVDIPISDEEARWTRVHILEGEEQALLLGRQFLRSFGREMFDWDKGVITLGKVKISIQEQAIGGDPLARARSVKQISNFSEDERFEGTQTDLNSDQQTKFVSLLK